MNLSLIHISSVVTGILLVVMGCLTATKQVRMGKFVESTPEFRQKASERVGNKIFIPAVSIGLMALALSFVKYNVEVDGVIKAQALDGAVMTGTACLVALVLAFVKMCIRDSLQIKKQVKLLKVLK